MEKAQTRLHHGIFRKFLWIEEHKVNQAFSYSGDNIINKSGKFLLTFFHIHEKKEAPMHFYVDLWRR